MKETALITGASGGIGKALAEIHAKKGGNLVVVARSKEKLETLKADLSGKYGVKVTVIVKDLSLPNAALEVYNEVNQKEIVVDYLINNAGFGGHGKFHERSWEDDHKMIQLNIVALTALTRFFLPDFVARNKGKIMNVSSLASLMPGPLQAVYFATKAYVTSFSNAIAQELKDTAITVTALLPGATDTGFATTSNTDDTPLFKKSSSAKSVAEVGYKAMMEGELEVKAGVSTGQKIMLSFLPFAPKKMLLKQVEEMQSKN